MILACTHGDEIGGIGVQLGLMTIIAEDPQAFADFEITFVIGNPAAVIAGKRYIERDLNRSYAIERMDSLEAVRAKTLEKLILGVDEVIDLHQTVQPSVTAFVLTAVQTSSLELIDRLDSTYPIVAYKGIFSADGMTSNSFAEMNRISSLTIEMGELGLHPAQIEETLSCVLNVFKNIDRERELDTNFYSRLHTWDQTVRADGCVELVPGLVNFSAVAKGAVLATRGTETIISEREGFTLFPKYGALAQASAELVRTVRPIPESELSQWI